MFAGFTSRCTSPASCAASSAEATGEMIAAARSAGSGPCSCSRVRTSPPGTYRIAMNSTPLASPASCTGMMCGSSTAAAALDSRRNRCRNAASDASPGASSFSATRRPSRSSTARNTTAIPPAPTCSSSRYPPTREPAARPASTAPAPPGAPRSPRLQRPRTARCLNRPSGPARSGHQDKQELTNSEGSKASGLQVSWLDRAHRNRPGPALRNQPLPDRRRAPNRRSPDQSRIDAANPANRRPFHRQTWPSGSHP